MSMNVGNFDLLQEIVVLVAFVAGNEQVERKGKKTRGEIKCTKVEQIERELESEQNQPRFPSSTSIQD